MQQVRSLGAFESKGVIYLETYCQTVVGLRMAQEPVFAIPKLDHSGLDRAVRACLEGVRTGIPHPTDWKKVARPLFAISPFKTDRALMAVAKFVSVMDIDGRVEFHAFRNEGLREGFRGDGPATITCKLDCDLSVGLLEALSQATYSNGRTEP